jgi:hypothetical protein
MKQSRADRYRRDHAIAMARLREITNRPPGPRRVRIRLAAAYLGTVAALAAVSFLPGGLWASLAQLAVLVVLVTLWVALRRATRLVTEAPDEVLDELLVRLRDGYFRESYQALGAAATLIGVLLLTVGDAYGITAEAGAAAGWALVALALGLPLVVAAFRLPDVDDEP